MLRSFRFGNHRSFRDEAELLLLPAYDKSRPVVPVAGIFGANASGKSNLLDALRWLRTAVLDSYRAWSPGKGIPRRPFRLDPATEARPSWFCVELIHGDARYAYGLETDDEQVREEWLYAYPRNRRRIIFERKNRTISLGSTVPDYRSRGELLAKNTRPNALFLTVAAHNDLAEVEPVFQWFQTGLTFASDRGVSIQETLSRWLWGPDHERLIALVRAADLGISDITMRYQPMLPPEVAERIAEISAGPPGTGKIRAMLEVLEEFEDQDPFTPPGDLAAPPLILFHHGSGRAVLDLHDQSAGTRTWLGLVANALQTLESGGVLVVDEVDASLHPHLTARLIELFRDSETNASGAQLLFTTHDATLLDQEVLRRDEIWFVEKEPDDGATKLYPLTDFHPRKNENVEGRYLAGGYGAVPVLTHTGFRDALEVGHGTRAAA